jgi:predicted P-loop ATPase
MLVNPFESLFGFRQDFLGYLNFPRYGNVLECNQEKFKKQSTVHTVVTAIENRQLNMGQHAQYDNDQIVKTILRTEIHEISEKLF